MSVMKRLCLLLLVLGFACEAWTAQGLNEAAAECCGLNAECAKAAEKPACGMLNIASYNMRFNNKRENPDNTWSERKPQVRALLEYYDFDIVGTQEPLLGQIKYLTDSLPQYSAISYPKADGVTDDETCTILYKTARLELLQKGNFWHSATPDTFENGGRITTWGKFKDKLTGGEFFVFNTHLSSSNLESRKTSIAVILKELPRIAGGSPFFLTGDFNATEKEETVAALVNSPIMADSKKVSKTPPYGQARSFNGFKFEPSIPKGETRQDYIANALPIDFIFVSKQISVLKYAVITDSFYGKFPSDHFPVCIKAVAE